MAPPKTLPHADWHGGTAILARELGPERGSARFHSRQPSPAKARRADTLPWRVQSAAPSEPPHQPWTTGLPHFASTSHPSPPPPPSLTRAPPGPACLVWSVPREVRSRLELRMELPPADRSRLAVALPPRSSLQSVCTSTNTSAKALAAPAVTNKYERPCMVTATATVTITARATRAAQAGRATMTAVQPASSVTDLAWPVSQLLAAPGEPRCPPLCGCSVSDPDGRWQVSPLALGKSGGRDAIDPLQPHGRPRLEDTG
ncbi:hypothetical protein PCL_10352 [Purpureocillium lilacinum]|uniref:Uncharacterized protein n=1 Tax=Purpureocillium lilacinum TaxID=33203 RepID=A0A2U3EFN5_PURLI|nr:hypothetical protein Purlil1_3756 [Purpureocillium lilacinum]PWI73337.1 hypothetical protein PCL_10352 [Purpureocillium lilacinum]